MELKPIYFASYVFDMLIPWKSENMITVSCWRLNLTIVLGKKI